MGNMRALGISLIVAGLALVGGGRPARLGGQAGRRGPSAHHGGEDEAARLANPTTSPPPPRSSRPCSRRPQCASTNSSALARTPIHTNATASQSFMASAYAMEADANLNASA